ncbi:hypothetical protein HR060_17165 [Catenovulum sp. SM1970]|uniref:hypothetical protein n=1 Tax=Marinifaba aquimaris TaxID=2741323 RepID=UPI001571D377|nr:hypothetical protein [Marinifaba aquimaris]NTS78576.1 hypothetical protein [Marinifaba aquimaris]
MENRRITRMNSDDWWDELNLTQKFAASSLFQYGYQLAFVRRTENGPLGVFTCDSKVVTIAPEGEIDLSPTISVR